MRILFLTPQLPYPPHQGTTLRNFGLIAGLTQRGHAITLLSFREEGQPSPADTPLVDLCEQVLTVPAPHRRFIQRVAALLRGKADLIDRLASDVMNRTLSDLLNRETFDFIQIEGLEIAAVMNVIGTDVVIYDAHNAEHALQRRIAAEGGPVRRIYSSIQARRLVQAERSMMRAAALTFACSTADAALLKELAPNRSVAVVPNAIHTAEYTPDGPTADLPQPAIVFTGKMDFRPNIDAARWFADAILPRIHERMPEVHFVIVGQRPAPSVQHLAEHPHITVTGRVPTIQPYIRAAAVYVAPLRMGSGTRFKLLETMAVERPVVSTTLGAEGLAVADGVHMRLADAEDDFASAVVDLLRSPQERQQLTANARELVRSRYDWEAVIPIVEDAYSALRG
ncbi:MAG: glycosyltransferase [Chloroflexi bacterium]|nr:glycosyltransferase [Chloroflexota bacterium]